MVVNIHKNRTASFDVDPQKGFTPLCPNELCVNEGHLIVDELNKMAEFAKYRVGSKDWHHPEALHIATEENPQFSPVNSENIDIRWNRHCIAGTYGAELLDGLPHWSEYDYFVWKGLEKDVHVYTACYHTLGKTRSTGVIEWLKVNNVTTVLVGGLALDFCVKETALDLKAAGFNVVLIESSTRAIAAPVDTENNTLTLAKTELINAGVKIIKSVDELRLV